MPPDSQIRSLVRVGMQFSSNWALYETKSIEIKDGFLIKLVFRQKSETIDHKPQIRYIYPSGQIEKGL